jgi:ribosomal protein S9
MKLMSNQVYSTGRRKESIARVWISNGTGNITINKKKIDDYFPDKALRMIINQPLEVAKKIRLCRFKNNGTWRRSFWSSWCNQTRH